MQIISSLFNYQLRTFGRFFKQRSLARSVTAVLFIAVFLGVAVGVFGFIRSGFILINNDEFLREAMSLYVFELFSLMMMYFIIVSAVISGVFTMFRSQSDAWVMIAPAFKYFPFWHYLRILVSSLWPLLFIAIPGLLAHVIVFKVGISAFVLCLVALALLVAFTVSGTLVVVFVVAKLLLKWQTADSKLSLRKLVTVLIFLIGVFTYSAWSRAVPQDLFTVLGAYDFTASSADIAPIFNQFRLFPSHHVAVIMLAVQKGNFQALTLPFLILCSLALSSHLLFWEVSTWYLPLWQVFQEGGFEARVARAQAYPSPTPFPRYLKGPIGALFEKEAVVIFRNVKHLIWLGFLLSLWFIFTSLNLVVKVSLEKYHLKSSLLPNIVFALQIVILAYFISAFVLRFVFPSFSTERKTAWIFGVVPLDLKRVFMAKFLFFTTTFTLLALIISLFNSTIFGLTQVKTGVFVVLALLLTVFVVTLGLVLGAIFPNFDTDDPEVLGTSLPGLAFVFGSLIYGGLGAGAYYYYLSRGYGFTLVLFELITVALVGFMLVATPRLLRRIEFVRIRA